MRSQAPLPILASADCFMVFLRATRRSEWRKGLSPYGAAPFHSFDLANLGETVVDAFARGHKAFDGFD